MMTGALPSSTLDRHALIVVDLQVGFEDACWGRRDNPTCETNVARLALEWRRFGRLVVFARHDSDDAGSPLSPGRQGNELKPVLRGIVPDLLLVKSVHSCFHGRPDLDAWLRDRGVEGLAICGITTDHCCDTTARVAADLGYHVLFVLDATHTFDRRDPDGTTVMAEDVARVTAASLHGEFAQVVSASDCIDALTRPTGGVSHE
jgi:nicotinamidase-related amidase